MEKFFIHAFFCFISLQTASNLPILSPICTKSNELASKSLFLTPFEVKPHEIYSARC